MKPEWCRIEGCEGKIEAHGLCVSHYARLRKHGDPRIGGPIKKRNRTVRFIREVALPFQGDDCLRWPFAIREDGYGRIKYRGINHIASRAVCEMAHGHAPTPEHEAAHSCGKGHLGCVNPRHLSWKTPAENQADRITHGTHRRGEKSPHAKLTEQDVLAIRNRAKSSTRAALAREFCVSESTIRNIARRKAWAWLGDNEHA